MSPSPQEDIPIHKILDKPKLPSDKEIVISGISGIFPKSGNVSEFMKNLYDKVDMVIFNDSNIDYPEAPKYIGKVPEAQKFDASFFRVTFNQALSMESMTRKLLENAYSAIYDSGINPLELKGTKLGVYVGTSYVDSSSVTLYNTYRKNGFIISGGCKCMCSNRISYFLDGKAPSVTIDCSNASDMICLEQAYQDMKSGICESALVAGCQICTHSALSVNLKRCGFLCLDGETRCFDQNGEGYVRAEAVSLLFLQKAKDAKRIYAEIVHAKTKFDLRPDAQFLPLRKSEEIKHFLKEFYSEAGVSPKDVEYVEGHGTAIVEADANELQAIGEVFGGKNSVMVGCVKSNMGNSEAAAGTCAVTKLCLAYQKGKLPANLHCDNPLDIPCVEDGTVKILTEIEPFDRGYTAINNFSFNGMNCHVLLKGHYKQKNTDRYICNLPRLVFLSGRHDKGLEKTINSIKNEPIDPEVFGMLHNIYKLNTIEHTTRAYAIFDTNKNQETELLAKSIKPYSGSKPPLWLVFSGMGSQWAGMGKELMRIPIFADAIEKCHKVLEPKGLDIVQIITDPEVSFNYILNCFVGIAAVQIGLIDILKELNLVPDYIIGHSVGEMGCAYFDGCFTTEEMILAAYTRGKVSVENDFIKGAMAAVGLGYNELRRTVPPEIDIACRNSFESCTISGPAADIKSFVDSLKAKGIFAKEVPSAEIAYHSRYISKAGPNFTTLLEEVLKHPVRRSEKWISTSIPRKRWGQPEAQFSCPEYHTNNLLSPVYFEDATKLIPSNAVVVEVAPHGLLQAILKRSHPSCIHIPLTSRGHSDPLRFLFEAFGKLYLAGINSNIDVLYPKIEFPVSTETPLISHLVKWYHNETWPNTVEDTKVLVTLPARGVILSVEDDDYQFLAGHVIEGNIIFPETAVIFLIWETFSMYKGLPCEEMPVAFRDVHFYEEISIDRKEPLKLNLMITRGSLYFEVVRDNIILATGYLIDDFEPTLSQDKEDNVQGEEEKTQEAEDVIIKPTEDYSILLNSDEIYRIMFNKGYHFKGDFQSIVSSSLDWNTVHVKWNGNWITFLDGILQCHLLSRNHDGISIPKVIKYLSIDVKTHIAQSKALVNGDHGMIAQLDKYSGATRCGGVYVKDIIFDDKPKAVKEPDVLQEQLFIPYHIGSQVDIQTALQINLQTVVDNITEEKITVLVCTKNTYPLSNIIETVCENIPDAVFKVSTLKMEYMGTNVITPNLLVTENFMNSMNNNVSDFIGKNTFILTLEENEVNLKKAQLIHEVISEMQVEGKRLVLLWRSSFDDENVTFIHMTNGNNSWVVRLRCELQRQRKAILISENQTSCDIFGLVKKIRREYNKNKISLFIIDDFEASPFNYEIDFYRKQLQKNLLFNILKENHWGSYHYLPSPKLQANYGVFKLLKTVKGQQWTEIEPKTSSDNTAVQVCFSGLSVKDAKIESGIESDNQGYGMDFSGLDRRGNRVMGLTAGGTLASIVQPDPNFLWPVPSHWSLEEAATVPLPYVHAVYSLTAKSKMFSFGDKTVFVTEGTEAFGQAVINISLANGYTVFTSVDDIYKKQFLIKLFPQLNENYIILTCCHSTLHEEIVYHTKNQYCDIVINTYKGVLRDYALKCIGQWGTFLDVNNDNMIRHKSFGMHLLHTCMSYYPINISNLFLPHNEERKQLIQIIISKGIACGIIKPISFVTYSDEEVSRSLRFLSSNKNTGRVLINIKDNQNSAKVVNVTPRMTFSSKSTYVVVCDENGLGIELADHLVESGARNLKLHMKNKNIMVYFKATMTKWIKTGVQVNISTKSLQTKSNCVQFLKYEPSAPIYGIFVVQERTKMVTDNDNYLDCFEMDNEVISVVSNLDLISKNNCPELRNFVIISRHSQNASDEYTATSLEQICKMRFKTGLPSLMFRTTLPYKNYPEDESTIMQTQSLDTALIALERSLIQKHNIVRTYDIKKTKAFNLSEKLSTILAVKNIDDLDGELPLKHIVPNEIALEKIKSALKEINNDIPTEDLRGMSLNRIRKFKYLKNKCETKFDSGLGAFYTVAERDEYLANEIIVPMNTITNKREKEEDLDANDNYLMLIPGFEGHHQAYITLCERLKISAVTLQLGPDFSTQSIKEIALDLQKYITKRFTLKSKFHLLGHSFGVNVALELAALLEKDGRTGVIYCLDSSPDALRIQMDSYLGRLSDSNLQNAIIEHFFNLFTGQKCETLLKEIEKCDNWLQKLPKCIDQLKKYVQCTTQYAEAVVDTAYKRMLLAKSYKPQLNLKSELVLLKGVPHPKSENLPSDYNLSKYSKKAIKVYDITSDVALAPNDYRVPNIVNKFLSPEIKDEFKKKNLCDTYFNAVLSLEKQN